MLCRTLALSFLCILTSIPAMANDVHTQLDMQQESAAMSANMCNAFLSGYTHTNDVKTAQSMRYKPQHTPSYVTSIVNFTVAAQHYDHASSPTLGEKHNLHSMLKVEKMYSSLVLRR